MTLIAKLASLLIVLPSTKCFYRMYPCAVVVIEVSTKILGSIYGS